MPHSHWLMIVLMQNVSQGRTVQYIFTLYIHHAPGTVPYVKAFITLQNFADWVLTQRNKQTECPICMFKLDGVVARFKTFHYATAKQKKTAARLIINHLGNAC